MAAEKWRNPTDSFGQSRTVSLEFYMTNIDHNAMCYVCDTPVGIYKVFSALLRQY